MRLETFSHERSGFTIPWLPALDSEQTLVLAFGGDRPLEDAAPLVELRHAYPRARFLGASAPSQILGSSMLGDSLVVAVARLESAWLRAASVAAGGPSESRAAAAELSRKLLAPRLRGVLVAADATRLDAAELARGLDESLPSATPRAVLLAHPGSRGAAAWVLDEGRPSSARASAVGFYGDSCRFEARRSGASDAVLATLSEADGAQALAIAAGSTGTHRDAGDARDAASIVAELRRRTNGAQLVGLLAAEGPPGAPVPTAAGLVAEVAPVASRSDSAPWALG